MSRTLKTLFTAIALSGLGVGLVACNPKSPKPPASGEVSAELQALIDLDAKYRVAVEARDFGRVIDLSMPPKLLRAFAETAGASEIPLDEVTAAVRQEIEGAFEMIQSFDYTMDLNNLKLESSPTGRTYALAPTVVNMKLGDMKMRSKGVTLAIMDEGRWYLLNPSDEETIRLIKQTFQDLADVTIKPNPIEVVK